MTKAKSGEASVLKRVMLAASQCGITIWRNNVGRAWMGAKVNFVRGSVLLQDGSERQFSDRDAIVLFGPRPVKFGLFTGSSDLIGIQPRTITPDDVGKTMGMFVALECKASSRSRVTADQKKFLQHVNDRGGIAAIIHNPAQVAEIFSIREIKS